MAENHMVRCVTKGSDGRITDIGGKNSDGTPWKMSADNAIAGMKNGKLKFYVSLDGKGVSLVVGSAGGRDYLKTVQDAGDPATLLALPECSQAD